MSRKRQRTRSRVPDLAAGAGQGWSEFPEAAAASAAPEAHSEGTRAPSASASASAFPAPGLDAVVRRTADGWRVGDDELPDLTCAMVLADLLAAELPTEVQPAIRPAPSGVRDDTVPLRSVDRRPPRAKPERERPAAAPPTMEEEAHRLRTTVGQLEHALTARIRVEQAIGVLAERHRIRPRQAFEQLRSAARNRGRRVIDIAADVVASATNPLLQLPEELSRQRSAPRHGGRHSRRALRPE
jgi:ANTAR domain